MNIRNKYKYIANWCKAEGLTLVPTATCGFCRPCVGVALVSGDSVTFPDYLWRDSGYTEISGNGDVWTPEDAYHKYPCVAVLNHGSWTKAIKQLYTWIKWFKDNGFHVTKELRTGEPWEIEIYGTHHIRLKRNLKP